MTELVKLKKNKTTKIGKTKRRHKARGQASQMPEIFGQLGVGKRKSQNKQIVWQKKITSAMHGQRSRDDDIQDKQLCVLVAQQRKKRKKGSKWEQKVANLKYPTKNTAKLAVPK